MGQGPEEDESQQQHGVEDLSKKHCKPAGIVGPSVRKIWDQTAKTHHLSCSSGVICVKTAQASVSVLILQQDCFMGAISLEQQWPIAEPDSPAGS